jgi:hypothetical protein
LNNNPINPRFSFDVIRDLLMQEWDPIGIADLPEASDEYDAYIPKIISLLKSNITVEEMQKHLFWLEESQMGLTASEERVKHVSDLLIALVSPAH